MISTFHYTHLESWADLGVGMITLQVHPAFPYQSLAPPIQDSAPKNNIQLWFQNGTGALSNPHGKQQQ